MLVSPWLVELAAAAFIICLLALEVGHRNVRAAERDIAQYKYECLEADYLNLRKMYYAQMVDIMYINEDKEVRERMKVFWTNSLDKLSRLPAEQTTALRNRFAEKLGNAITQEEQAAVFQDYMWELELLPDPS